MQVTGKNSQLILDDNGNAGAFTPLPNSTTTDLTLRNGAVGIATGSLSLGNLLINSNSSILVSNYNLVTLSISARRFNREAAFVRFDRLRGRERQWAGT